MASAEEQLIQKGIERGFEEGIEKGTRSIVLKFMRARFGALDADVERKIEEASTADLDRYIDRAVVATRLEDVFDG